jgi:hypothetical protein
MVNSSILMSGLLFGLILAEIGFRLFLPQYAYYPKGLYIANEAIGYFHASNFNDAVQTSLYKYEIHTNSLGLRDNPVLPKSDDVFRIFSMGDSYSFGSGVSLEETYHKVLERLGNDPEGHLLDVVNGGVRGYGTVQELGMYKQLEEDVNPDLILLLVGANDPDDNMAGINRTVMSGFLVTTGGGPKAWVRLGANYASYYTDVGHAFFEVMRKNQ